MKRILTIQDFSCLGRCSLTVALPVISAAGVECCGIPTALLSNHTGFSSFYFSDLSEKLLPIGSQLQELGTSFDAVYTGYIASAAQLELISQLIDRFRGENTLVLVDPVMGDNGRLYAALGGDFPEKMAQLCQKADVIMPNITEACLLTDMEYHEDMTDEEYCDILEELYSRYHAGVVLTGVPCDNDRSKIGAVYYDGKGMTGSFMKRYPLTCAGTGDIFSSAFLGAVMREKSYGEAMDIAVRYTNECVKLTAEDSDRRSYGVNFEQALPLYIDLLNGRCENA